MAKNDKQKDEAPMPEAPPAPAGGYVEMGDGTVLRVADGAVIPKDPQNRDYMHYLQHKAAQEN